MPSSLSPVFRPLPATGSCLTSSGVQVVASLVFHVQPAGAVAGVPFTTQPVIWALDSMGALVTGFTGNVSLSLDVGTGTITGTNEVACVGGVATFTNIACTEAGDKALQAFAAIGPFTVNSASFTVNALASSFMTLNSNIDSGGGTDITTVLNSTLAGLPSGVTLFLDGYGLVSGTIKVPENVTFKGTGVSTSGLFLATHSDCLGIQNTNLSGAVVTAATGGFGNFTFNQNGQNQHKFEANDTNNMWVIGCWIGGVSSFTLYPMVMRNAKTFAFLFSNFNGITCTGELKALWDNALENGSTVNNWDAIHFYGPANNFTLGSLWGNGDDNQIALNTDEGSFIYATAPGAFGRARFPVTSGNTTNFNIQSVWFELPSSSIRIYNQNDGTNYGPSGVDNITIANVRGDVFFPSANPPAWVLAGNVTIGTVTINGWYLGGGSDIDLNNGAGTQVAAVVLNNIVVGTNVSVSAASTSGNYFSGGLIPAEIAQYNFDDALDSVGRYNLTNHGGATFGPGKIGNCVTLNGTSQYLTNSQITTGSDIPAETSPPTAVTVDFTVVGWIKRARSTNDNIFTHYGNFTAYYVGYSLNSDFGCFMINSVGTGFSSISVLPIDSNWHFVAIRFSVTNHTVETRVDGDAWVLTNWTGTFGSTGVPVYPFTFGCNYTGGTSPGTPASFFGGSLDSFRVYRGALSDAAVNAIYNSGAGTEA